MPRQDSKRKRVPVSGNRNILTVSDKDDGYVYRWVNDEPGRIKRFEEGGYELVIENVGNIGDKSVDNPSGSSGVKSKTVGINRELGKVQEAYLMKIPKEWYKEDQAKKQEIPDKVDQAMRDKTKEPGFYGKININDHN